MQVVFVPEQSRDFVLVAGWNELRLRKSLLEILDDIVALDMDGAVMAVMRGEACSDGTSSVGICAETGLEGLGG